MNRGELRTLVLQNTKRPDKLDLINTALDLAVAEVSSEHLWSDLMETEEVTLLDGELSVALADTTARVSQIIRVEGTLSAPIVIKPKTWIDRYYPNPAAASEGKPVLGYLMGRTLFVTNPVDQDYTIRYSHYPLQESFTSDIDTLLIRHASKAVVAFATYWVFHSTEKYQDAQQWLGVYAMAVASAKKLDNANSVTQQAGDMRGATPPYGRPQDYWNDPFCKHVP